MNTITLEYIPLTQNDTDIAFLQKIHDLPQISRFIGIDKDIYFHYVTTTENVVYYKILLHNNLVATLHCECVDDTLYLSLLVIPEYQKRGIGSQILRDVKLKKLDLHFSKIQVAIEKDNIASVRLFKNMGFTLLCEEDELWTYII